MGIRFKWYIKVYKSNITYLSTQGAMFDSEHLEPATTISAEDIHKVRTCNTCEQLYHPTHCGSNQIVHLVYPVYHTLSQNDKLMHFRCYIIFCLSHIVNRVRLYLFLRIPHICRHSIPLSHYLQRHHIVHGRERKDWWVLE